MEVNCLGSQASEETLIRKFVTDINNLRVENRDRAHAPRIARVAWLATDQEKINCLAENRYTQ